VADLEYTTHDNVARLTLNRPEKMNALGNQLILLLEKALDEIERDTDIRAVLLTGRGRAFCAGADLKERQAMEPQEVAVFVARLRRTFLRLYHLNKITLAMINGHALGGGLELALSCDLRLAADSARLGLTETRLAIIPGAGGTQLLPRIIGQARAKELIFTAEPISAQRAEQIGLVHGLESIDQLEERALAMLTQITANGPIALQMAKKAIQLGFQGSLEQGLEIERLCYAQTIPTEDRLEGLRAFREKRQPRYNGT